MTTLTRISLAGSRTRWLLDTLASLIDVQRRLAAWRRQHDTLAALDTRTLHDLGLSRSEVGSVAAECVGLADRTRRR